MTVSKKASKSESLIKKVAGWLKRDSDTGIFLEIEQSFLDTYFEKTFAGSCKYDLK